MADDEVTFARSAAHKGAILQHPGWAGTRMGSSHSRCRPRPHGVPEASLGETLSLFPLNIVGQMTSQPHATSGLLETIYRVRAGAPTLPGIERGYPARGYATSADCSGWNDACFAISA